MIIIMKDNNSHDDDDDDKSMSAYVLSDRLSVPGRVRGHTQE
jgi:hypothetical protein